MLKDELFGDIEVNVSSVSCQAILMFSSVQLQLYLTPLQNPAVMSVVLPTLQHHSPSINSPNSRKGGAILDQKGPILLSRPDSMSVLNLPGFRFVLNGSTPSLLQFCLIVSW